MTTEPCPFCGGTGQRVVAPPIAPRGNPGGRRHGRRHGFEATYQIGCRCDLCRAAHRQYRKTQRRRIKADATNTYLADA